MRWELCAHMACTTQRFRRFFGLSSTVIAKLTYASSAWWGFATNTDRQRLQVFIRRSHRNRFVSPSVPPLDELCRASDDKLFASITNNREHVLHELLPPQSVASQNYNLRPRKHRFELPGKTSHLTDCNFMQRMLFLDIYWRSTLSCYFHFISFVYIFISHSHILYNNVLSAFWQSLIKYMMVMMMMMQLSICWVKTGSNFNDWPTLKWSKTKFAFTIFVL